MLRVFIFISFWLASSSSYAESYYSSLCRELEGQHDYRFHGRYTDMRHIAKKAALQLYKAPNEHCASRKGGVEMGGVFLIYESYDRWVYVEYLNKERASLLNKGTPDTDEEGVMAAGWVTQDRLNEIAK